MQTVLIADHTDTAELSLWEDFIGAVDVEESYKFHYLMVEIFNDKRSLFTPKANLQIEKIPDLQDVSQVGSVKRTKEMQHAQISAVSDSTTFHKCIACRDGDIVTIRGNDTFGRCSECKTALKMDSGPQQTSALLTIQSTKEGNIKLFAVDHQLSVLADLPVDQVDDLALLTGKQFKVVYNTVSKHIVEILEY